jgi:hypothetical protein
MTEKTHFFACFGKPLFQNDRKNVFFRLFWKSGFSKMTGKMCFFACFGKMTFPKQAKKCVFSVILEKILDENFFTFL